MTGIICSVTSAGLAWRTAFWADVSGPHEEMTMKHLSFATSALLLMAGAFSAAAPSKASAFPLHPSAATPDSAVVEVLCKYGTPNCINRYPGPGLPSVGGVKIPDSGWVDPDCKYYGNCNTGSPGSWGDPSLARKGGGTSPATGGIMRRFGGKRL
jgi:hypothetical protein